VYLHIQQHVFQRDATITLISIILIFTDEFAEPPPSTPTRYTWGPQFGNLVWESRVSPTESQFTNTVFGGRGVILYLVRYSRPRATTNASPMVVVTPKNACGRSVIAVKWWSSSSSSFVAECICRFRNIVVARVRTSLRTERVYTRPVPRYRRRENDDPGQRRLV